MKVSIIVPCYNVEKYLTRCLDSVIAQTEKDLEIICVDDGSTDSTPSILNDYSSHDSRIKIIARANGGVAAARNSGLAAATGDWITFVDSDDWIPQDAIEKYLEAALESGASVVVSSKITRNSLNRPLGGKAQWKLVSPALPNIVGNRQLQSSACNKFYRAMLLENRRFIEGIYFEDWPFVTELFGAIDSFALLEGAMYVYCSQGSSTVRSSFTEKKVASYLAGIEFVSEKFKDHPLRKIAMKRSATAAAMLTNKVWKSKDPNLRQLTKRSIKELAAKGALRLSDMPLKSRFRLWRM